ncbi:unnamed protein product [Chondrus crispus]|uniref:Uncharacterized protein n=2 Tax=Chondrus crispus TaxID=2769 RepID=R7QPG1_CHOCR|nr:unnamed protein product [Chondrus crispus]CDF40377.1 unnamed protein product [Chondrus crispus]|eukprot:XP_005710671.1 unnamed protein product [Chondrus crispus]
MCKCVECPCSNHLLRDGWKQGGRRQGYGIPPWLSDQHLFVVTPSSRPRPGTLPCARWDGQRRHCFLPRPFLLAGHSHSPEVRQSETRCNLNVIYTCIVKSLLQYISHTVRVQKMAGERVCVLFTVEGLDDVPFSEDEGVVGGGDRDRKGGKREGGDGNGGAPGGASLMAISEL